MNKKKLNNWLILLMIGVIINLPCFSQTVTQDTSKILLDKKVARLVIKDIIEKDGLQIQNNIKDSIISKYIGQLSDKDTLINTHIQIIYNLEKKYEQSNKQYLEQAQLSKYYFDRWNEQKKTTYVVGGGGILLTLLTILILK